MQVDFLVREWNLHFLRGRVSLAEEESKEGSGAEAEPQTSPQFVPTEESGAPRLPCALDFLRAWEPWPGLTEGSGFFFPPQKESWHFYIIRYLDN